MWGYTFSLWLHARVDMNIAGRGLFFWIFCPLCYSVHTSSNVKCNYGLPIASYPRPGRRYKDYVWDPNWRFRFDLMASLAALLPIAIDACTSAPQPKIGQVLAALP